MSDGPAPPKTPAPTSAPATLTEIPVALVDCPEDAESIANSCTRENELCTCSESYGNCPTDYSSYGLGPCGIKFRASHAIDATLSP
jgi:hypothetical protein